MSKQNEEESISIRKDTLSYDVQSDEVDLGEIVKALWAGKFFIILFSGSSYLMDHSHVGW